MGDFIQLVSGDGFNFQAYESRPSVEPKGALIVIQEIFGITEYIRSVVDSYASEGYHTLAPALMDRIEPGIEYGFDQAPLARGAMLKCNTGDALADIQATLDYLANPKGVATLGFCWGGLLAFLTARDMDTICNIAYYGGRTQDNLDRLPKSPMQFHFGDQDTHIPMDAIEKVKTAMPNEELYIYPCGHAFDNNSRPSYSPQASALAKERSLAFLNKHFDG